MIAAAYAATPSWSAAGRRRSPARPRSAGPGYPRTAQGDDGERYLPESMDAGVDQGKHAHHAGQDEMQRDAISATLPHRVFLPLVNAQLDDDNPQGQERETSRRERLIESDKIHYPLHTH